MILKYCYNNEIHKSFSHPPTFQALLDDIKRAFDTKLPAFFSIQYKDNDQDLITISSDLEYRSMLAFDTPDITTAIKIFITPSNKAPEEKEMSFEVIESSRSDISRVGISEISLSQDDSVSGREESPSPQHKPGAGSLRDCDTSREDSREDDCKVHVSCVEPYVNQTFSQVYQPENYVLEDLHSKSEGENESENDEPEDKRTNVSHRGLLEEPDSRYLYTELQGNAHSLENSIFSNEIDRFTEELAAKNARNMLEKLRNSSQYENLRARFVSPPQEREQEMTDGRQIQDESNDCNGYLNQFYQKRKLWDDRIKEINSESSPKIKERSISPKQRGRARFPTQRKIVNCDNYIKNKRSTFCQSPGVQYDRQEQPYQGYRSLLNLLRNDYDYDLEANVPYHRREIQQPRLLQPIHSYQVTTGTSSRLFSLEVNEGQRVVYKTIFVKNTGTQPWKKCYVKPVGLIAGKTVELNDIEAGQTAIVTLELTGYFESGNYISRWKLVHENQYGMTEVIGGPFDVEFEIGCNVNEKMKENVCEQSFEEDFNGRHNGVQKGYMYDDYDSREEENFEVEEGDQTFARYLEREEGEIQDDESERSIDWFMHQDLLRVRNFVSENNEPSLDELYIS